MKKHIIFDNHDKIAKKIKAILIVLLFTTNVFAIDNDKKQHFIYSAGIASTTTAIAKHYGKSNLESYLYGVGFTVGIGVLKELADSRSKNHTADMEDVYADILGAVTGSLLTFRWRW